jgi:hypothetical protein
MAAIEDIRERFRTDGLYYADHALHIPNEVGEIVPLRPRPGQHKIEAAIQKQQAAGEPIRLIILKSRRLGSSSWCAGTLLRRLTQNRNRRGQIVAQDRGTGGELFELLKLMYQHLPNEDWLKPPIYRSNDTKDSKLLWWGEKSPLERDRGNLGINSQLTIDTAAEVEAGRGKTLHDLLCTEVAFWPNPKKALSLLNAVYDLPETMVILESTANGHNWFKDRWDAAERGEGNYLAVFIGWQEDLNNVRAFADDDERERFIASIGTGPWGEDEPRLVEEYGCTPEQLNWRRNAIVDKANSDLDYFRQEFPSYPLEAFIASGRHVFAAPLVRAALDNAETIQKLEPDAGGPEQGVFRETGFRERRVHSGTVEVPTGSQWTPASATGFPPSYDFWVRWNPKAGEKDEQGNPIPYPGPKDQFIVAVDPATGEQNTTGQPDFSVIQVIDHRTREQVARLRTRRLDADELALQAVLAAQFFNDALITVETTGGYGIPVTRKLWDGFGWRRVYKRRSLEQKAAKASDRLGWDTNRRTKPQMIEGLREMLREGTHGLRDPLTVFEMQTYVVDAKGRQDADAGAHDDLLTAYMQGQEVARETRLRPDGPSGITHTWTTDRRRF